jgi:antagonist of KipI
MSTLTVLSAGLLTTVQDEGRWGWQSRGVPVAGPMDPNSYRMANALVGNDTEAAGLEVSFGGPELAFDDDRLVAVCGGLWDVTAGGHAVPMNTPVAASAGERLKFSTRRRGARAYIAVSGGIDVPAVFGSRSTHVRTAMGGFHGRALRAGDRLPLGRRTRESFSGPRVKKTPDSLFGTPSSSRVRILPGPHLERLRADALDLLQSAPYTVSVRSDRMGFRLAGPRLAHRGRPDMLSAPTALGAIQVPPSGEPIVLMADRQTMGGYPIAATIISADIGIAGQLGPGDAVAFTVCTLQEAMNALIAQEQALRDVRVTG